MGSSRRQLKAMLRKNWLLKIRHPTVTLAEILLPTAVMLILIAVRTQVDTQIHPSQVNFSNPKIKRAIVFHDQGPKSFDYLNLSWAFSGFPDIQTIMDVNGPYLNDLELGVNTAPILQYNFSGFLTQTSLNTKNSDAPSWHSFDTPSPLKIPWTQFSPSTIRVAPFPTREYTDDEFQSIIKEVMGVLYLLGFLYPMSCLISYSVFEKDLDAFVVIVVNIAFSFIPASFAVSVVKANKHMLAKAELGLGCLGGNQPRLELYPRSRSIRRYSLFLPTILIFLEYGFAIASSTYCLTDDPLNCKGKFFSEVAYGEDLSLADVFGHLE